MDEAAIYEVLVGRKVATGPHTWNVYDASDVLIAENIVLRANPGALFTFSDEEVTRRSRRLINPIREAKTQALGGLTRTRGNLALATRDPKSLGVPTTGIGARALSAVSRTLSHEVAARGGAQRLAVGSRVCAAAHTTAAKTIAVAGARGGRSRARYTPPEVCCGAATSLGTSQAYSSYTEASARGVRNLSDVELAVAAFVALNVDRR